MTVLEARIRRRLFGTREVSIFRGGDEVFGSDDDVVKMRRTPTGVRLWCFWSDWHHDEETNLEVLEWWFPVIDELRVRK